MRNVFLCAMLFIAGTCFAQHQSNSHGEVILNVYDQNDKVIKSEALDYEEAKSFNFQSFFNHNSSSARMTIKGRFSSDVALDYYHFDSRSIEKSFKDITLCESHKQTLKPFIGVAALSVEDFNGVLIERVVEGAPAAQIGLSSGMTILNLGEFEIRSVCDLRIAVSSFEVGENVEIVYDDLGTQQREIITIGAILKNEISFKACEEQELNVPSVITSIDANLEPNVEFSVYPNPIKDFGTLKFKTSDNSSATIYLMDVYGNNLLKKIATPSQGSLELSIDLSAYTAGTYLIVIEQNNRLFNKQIIKVLN